MGFAAHAVLGQKVVLVSAVPAAVKNGPKRGAV